MSHLFANAEDAAAHAVPALPVPALPEPVHNINEDYHNPHQFGQFGGVKEEAPVATEAHHVLDQSAMAEMASGVDTKLEVDEHGNPVLTKLEVDEHGNTIMTKIEVDEHGNPVLTDESAAALKKRIKKLRLSYHEALTYASRGVYVDIETNQLRCSCNHKICDKWDLYGYTRHFLFKCHKKYEEERLDDAENQRLREAKAAYIRANPIPVVEDTTAIIRKKRKRDEGNILSVTEVRVQESHWMEMWREAKNELKQLRRDLKEETDEEIRGELMADIEGLKKRKVDWARLLGINETPVDTTITF